MTKYICNDCNDGGEFQGVCRISLPFDTGKPKYCPILKIKCKWIQL